MKYIIIYLAVLNSITFLLYAIDKYKAKNNKWRISESTLLWSAFLGGSIGAYIGMRVCHHKTRKNPFRFGIPAMVVFHLILILIYALYAPSL